MRRNGTVIYSYKWCEVEWQGLWGQYAASRVIEAFVRANSTENPPRIFLLLQEEEEEQTSKLIRPSAYTPLHRLVNLFLTKLLQQIELYTFPQSRHENAMNAITEITKCSLQAAAKNNEIRAISHCHQKYKRHYTKCYL